MYKSSRIVAGEDLRSEVLKCARQSIDSALEKGVYGKIDMAAYAQQLKTIFPHGVCDYDADPMGKPPQLMHALKSSVNATH